MRVSLDEHLSPAPQVLTRTVGDEMVLLDLESELYFGLDPVGAAMWQAVCDEGTLLGAVTSLSEVYDAPKDVLQADLEELVAQLIEKQLLRVGTD